MAYVAVISLLRTLEQFVQLQPHWISAEIRIMVDSLLVSLEYFQNFLENMSKRSQDHGHIKELERDIRTVVNEAEDVIELKIYEINQLDRTIASKALCEILPPLVEKIDLVKREVMGSSFSTDKIHGYGDPMDENLQLGHSSRQVANLNLETIVVGLEDDLMKIKRRLTGPPSMREVVPILGMGGISKTTLAKKAYDDSEIRHRFDFHVWVTVSQEYRIRDLLLGVLSCTSNEIKETDDQLMDMIYKNLKRKRYLVVMDDIWSNDVWDLMTRTFPDDNNGSRIILTSRLKDVAMHADPDSPPHEMRLLSSDESWKLLHDKVFGVKHEICPPELKDIGKQVAQKCQGLPLALLVFAGHLSKIARTPESWRDVAKSVSIVAANESDKCLGVLAMSYNYLPNHLKPCFLYMGVFPEDSEVNIVTLIKLWVSEGFLGKEKLKSMEQVGRDCWEDLVSRHLIMVRKRRFNGEARTCGVHDLVRDLILREAEKEKFLQVTRTHEAMNPSAKKLHVRRYSFHPYIYEADCWEESSLIRTVHLRGFGRFFHFEHFKLLRVLVIPYFEFRDFPLEITKLVHLRYLQFWCSDDIHLLVSKLYNLQTFIFRHEALKPPTIPETIWEMKHLRHLQVVKRVFSLAIPKSGFKLENLEGLSCLNLSSCTYEMFSAIPNLKRLKIHGNWSECKRDKIYQHLDSLSCLKELEILKFKYQGRYRPQLPRKFSLPTSLKRLTLTNTLFPLEDMTNIVMLPNLEVLKIKDVFDNDEWRLNDEEIFSQLKFLLISVTFLRHWEAGSVNFPKLQRLVLRSCIGLEEIPKDFGEIYSLESIELYDCSMSAAKSVEELQEEQASMGNDCLSAVINNCVY
nr:PREDICTED: putative late blight resistance protein homolog R1A-10 [Nicotiana tabacum]